MGVFTFETRSERSTSKPDTRFRTIQVCPKDPPTRL
jgi:hypothetical protein